LKILQNNQYGTNYIIKLFLILKLSLKLNGIM